MSNELRLPVEAIPPGWDTLTNPQGIRSYTFNHFLFDETSSSLQKAIRRGNSLEAIQWSLEMFLAGNKDPRTNVWNRLLVMTFEDVGLADVSMFIKIKYLFSNFRDNPSACAFAAYLLAGAKKSRLNDWVIGTCGGMQCINPDEYLLNDSDSNNYIVGTPDFYMKRLEENMRSKNVLACIFWCDCLTYTKQTVSYNRNTNAQEFIWIAFEKFYGNDAYYSSMKSLGRSDNWKNNDKCRLIYAHIINLHCNDMWPKVDPSWIQVAFNQELVAYVDSYIKRQVGLYGVPEYAMDKHTRRGGNLNLVFVDSEGKPQQISERRNLKHFYEIASKLENTVDNLLTLEEWYKQFGIESLTASGLYN